MSEAWTHVIMVLGVLAAVLTVASGLIYAERRVLALFQDRVGPNRVGPAGLLQLVADMIKIAAKEDWIPPFADRATFLLAPAIVMATTMMSFAVISYSPGLVVADVDIGLLFFLGMSSLAVYGSALSGWASNSKYPLIGSLRAVGQMISYEVFMGLSLMGVVMLAGSFSLSDIVLAQSRIWFFLPQFPGMLVFLVAAMAEVRRTPFDLPEADSELVAGYHTEYSGMKFAMFFLGEYVGLTLISALIVTLFFGGWMGPLLPPALWFLIKTMLVIGLLILVRGSLGRPRYDQLMALGWKLLLPLAVLNLLATGAVVLLWN